MIEHLDGIFETVTFRENMQIRISDMDICEDFPDHWHTPMEIIHATKNWYKIVVDGRTYRLNEGEIAIIRPGTIHALHAPDTGSRTIYLADLSFLGGISNLETLLALLPPVTTITPEREPELYRKAVELLSFMEEEYAGSRSFYDMLLYGALIELLGLLGRYAISPSVSANTLGPQSAKYAERFLYVCNYINEHCTEDLSLETIAGIAGFSKYHFTRLLKDFTHTSFYRYLNKKRISHAEQLLINPEYSVTEVALQSGFSSLSAFIRMFKQLKGCTPTEFKRMYSLDCMNRVDGDSAPDTLSGK